MTALVTHFRLSILNFSYISMCIGIYRIVFYPCMYVCMYESPFIILSDFIVLSSYVFVDIDQSI